MNTNTNNASASPKVSVIVPCYKVEQFLPTCIESLIGQTLQELEIILVDDGSPDNSGAICDAYAGKDKRIKVLHKKNGGVSAARNDGLAIANGEYVIFVDSDDYIPLHAYERMYSQAKKTDADIVIGDIYRVFDNKLEYCAFFRDEFTTGDPKILLQLINADMYKTYCPFPSEKGPAFGYGGPWNKLVKKTFLLDKKINFDLRVKGIFDDIIFTACIFAASKLITYIHEPVYYYRLLNSSITKTYKSNMLEINTNIANVWKEFMKQYDKDGLLFRPFCANIVRRLDESLTKYFYSESNPMSPKDADKELSAAIHSYPYKEALRGVQMSKLTLRHKLLVVLARINCIKLIRHLFA